MKKYFLIILCSIHFVSFSQKKNYNIGILVDNKTSKVNRLLQQLEKEVKAVVGEDAVVSFPLQNILANNNNLSTARLNYSTLLNNNTDIIIAFGLVNNSILAKETSFKKPTLLFGAVHSDFTPLKEGQKTSGIHNFNFLMTSHSYGEDLATLKKLSNFKKVGIAVEQKLMNILPLETQFSKETKALEVAYKLIPYNTVSDILNNLDDVDAFYLADGFYLTPNEIKKLAKVLIDKKIPSFTTTNVEDVEAGLMSTNQGKENINQFFRRIALAVEAYVNGENFSELPVYIDYYKTLTVNYNTAELINIPIKYSLISNTNFVGEFKNSLSEEKYNLLDAINKTIDKNLSLQSSKKDIEISGQNIKSAKSNYLPNVSSNLTGAYIDPEVASVINPEYSTSGNIILNQTIFSPAANANIGIQKDLQKAQEEIYTANELDAVFNVSNIYFNTLILKSNAQVQIQNLDLTKKNIQIATQNFEAGQSGKSDMLRFKSEMSQNTQAMIEAINQLEQNFVYLNQILNNPIDTEIDIEDVELGTGIFEKYNYNQLASYLDDPTLRDPFIKFLIEEAIKNAPELKSLDHNISATNRNIKLYKLGRYIPTLALKGQYNREFNRSGVGSPLLGPEGNYNVGLSLSLPIFNQNTQNINKQTAIIQKDQLEINKQNTSLTIATNVKNTVYSLTNQIANINLSKVSLETAKESLELTQASYSAGAVTIVQLIDAQNNYLKAQLSKNNAIYNFLINSLQLERYIGYYFLLHTDTENETFKRKFQEFLTK